MGRIRLLAAVCGGLMVAAVAPPLEAQMGLNRVEYLALQQELRSRGCGDIAAGGQVDAATQRALQVCAQQLGVAANARAVLHAMNIGFGPGEEVPTIQQARDPAWQPEFTPEMQPGVEQPMQPIDPQMQPVQPTQPEPGYPAQPPAGQAPPPTEPTLETQPPAAQPPGDQPPPTQPPTAPPPAGQQPPAIP